MVTEEQLITNAKRIVYEEGANALTIPRMAQECQVSEDEIGTFFQDRRKLIIRTLSWIWDEMLPDILWTKSDDFVQFVQTLYEMLLKTNRKYGGLLTDEFGLMYEETSILTESAVSAMRQSLFRVLSRDPNVREDVFDEEFMREDLACFIYDNIAMQILSDHDSIAYLIALIERLIY